MLYRILKIPARIALLIYCKKIQINKNEFLQSNGPLLIAANHPNSFLDAVIIATLFNKPVYSLARGDAFVNKFVRVIFRSLKILPVYRISEGSENLNHNYSTFGQCRDIFKKNGIVLIFSEGLCVNEWKLRPLKKGTARLALSSWEEGIPLTILPLGINYDSFHSFGKSLIIKAGNCLNQNDFDEIKMNGNSMTAFNKKLQNELMLLVEDIENGDADTIAKRYHSNISPAKKWLLFLPGLLGKWIHYPIYEPIKKIIRSKAKNTVHYDSILIGVLFFAYPFALTAISFITYSVFGSYYWLLPIILIPLLAWAYIQTKKELK